MCLHNLISSNLVDVYWLKFCLKFLVLSSYMSNDIPIVLRHWLFIQVFCTIYCVSWVYSYFLLTLMVTLHRKPFSFLPHLAQTHPLWKASFMSHLPVNTLQNTTTHLITFCSDNLPLFFFFVLYFLSCADFLFLIRMQCLWKLGPCLIFCSSNTTFAIILNSIKFRNLNVTFNLGIFQFCKLSQQCGLFSSNFVFL